MQQLEVLRKRVHLLIAEEGITLQTTVLFHAPEVNLNVKLAFYCMHQQKCTYDRKCLPIISDCLTIMEYETQRSKSVTLLNLWCCIEDHEGK